MADLGSILRESRQTAHLSQETAAMQSFCDVSTIRRYENGSVFPSWDTICMLSDVYGDPGLKYRAQDVYKRQVASSASTAVAMRPAK